jgi:hypothetical protein
MAAFTIRDAIYYNTTIKTHDFVTTKLTGLAHIKTGMVITDDNNEVSQCLAMFPHLILGNQTVMESIFDEGSINEMITHAYANHPIVIGCRNQQWSYVLYMITTIMVGNPPSFEHAAVGLKSIIERGDGLEDIIPDTINRIAIILANYTVFEQFSESVPDRSVMDEEIFLLVSEEYDRQILMLSLVFESDIRHNVRQNDISDDISDDRPPILPYTERLIDPNDLIGDLDPIDPEMAMEDTSGEKPKPFPKMDDCLGITSYDGYEPTPDEEEMRDEIKSKAVLASKFNELKSLMSGVRFNEEYSKNLLQSGMTVDEVLSLLILTV